MINRELFFDNQAELNYIKGSWCYKKRFVVETTEE